MTYDGWDEIDRSRAAFRKRIEELDRQHVESAQELGKILREMTNLSRREIREGIAAALFRAFLNLVRETPHDTGRLRAGWRISDSGPNSLPDKGLYPEFQTDNSIVAAIAQSIECGQRLSSADVLWIYNNVEYVLALNAGWSTKQPGGFIDRFLASMKRELEKIAEQ